MATAAAVAGSAILGAASSRSASRRAADAQTAGQQMAIDAAREAREQTRADAIPLFQSAQQNALAGFQGALDVFGDIAPLQFEAFQQGNVGAQQTLLGGLGQQQAAILGGRLNPNALQVQQLDLPDASLFQRDLPQFQSVQGALGMAGTPGTMGPSSGFIGGPINPPVDIPGLIGDRRPGSSGFSDINPLGHFGSNPINSNTQFPGVMPPTSNPFGVNLNQPSVQPGNLNFLANRMTAGNR